MSKKLGLTLLAGSLIAIAGCNEEGKNTTSDSSAVVHQVRDSVTTAGPSGQTKSSQPKDMPGKDMAFMGCVPAVKDEINKRNGHKGNEQLLTAAAVAICARQRNMWVKMGAK